MVLRKNMIFLSLKFFLVDIAIVLHKFPYFYCVPQAGFSPVRCLEWQSPYAPRFSDLSASSHVCFMGRNTKLTMVDFLYIFWSQRALRAIVWYGIGRYILAWVRNGGDKIF